MKVAEYLHDKGITADELAALLSERLSRSIKTPAVIARGDKDMPKSWQDALGIEDVEIVEPPPEVSGAKAKRQSDGAPKPTAEFNPMLAEERVAALYSMVGRGVAAATKEPRYRQAFDSHADKCGKAWADLAKHDKHVATVLNMLTAGGPWGEVFWLHASLGFSLVVISGKVDLGGIGIPGSPAASPARPTESSAAADGDGARTAGAPDTLA